METYHLHPKTGSVHMDQAPLTYSSQSTCPVLAKRPVVVIDPEDRESIERLLAAYQERYPMGRGDQWGAHADKLQDALREFADPTPQEPTDPKARVTDRRENVWRLLADGDWVCTSGPDCGEYLVWSQLAERGPLTIEGVTR